MRPTIADYLSAEDDTYRPPSPLPSSQQYDNYQIYNLYCTDTVYQVRENGVLQPNEAIEFQDFLAVQAYSPDGVPDDFDLIIRAYP